MKISSLESTRAGQITAVSGSPGVGTVNAQTSGSASGPAASVEISTAAQAYAGARAEAAGYVATVNSVPDRQDKIDALKSRIAAGTYQVSSVDIASQMLRRAQADRIHQIG